MFPTLENTLSEEADETGIARICLASLASVGYIYICIYIFVFKNIKHTYTLWLKIGIK